MDTSEVCLKIVRTVSATIIKLKQAGGWSRPEEGSDGQAVKRLHHTFVCAITPQTPWASEMPLRQYILLPTGWSDF